MCTYHQLLSNHCGFKINAIMKMWYIQHCGHYAGCLVFDWQCEKKNYCELEYKVLVVS